MAVKIVSVGITFVSDIKWMPTDESLVEFADFLRSEHFSSRGIFYDSSTIKPDKGVIEVRFRVDTAKVKVAETVRDEVEQAVKYLKKREDRDGR